MPAREKQKPVTVAELARRLRLSPTTVSFVLNGRTAEHRIPPATAKRVREEAARMHYRPNPIARQLAGMRSNAVGVLICTEAIADPQLVQRMEILAAQRELRFIVGHAVGTCQQVKKYIDDFRARGVDAVISIFHSHPDYVDTVLPELAPFENVVYFERPDEKKSQVTSPCFVQPDYYETGRLGVQHVIDRGRQRVALVMNDLVYPYARARHQAYKDTLKAAGRKVDPRLVWVMDQQPGAQWSEVFDEERAMQAVDDVVVRGRADAIVAVKDLSAARLMYALHRRGIRVPDDVAVVGCDNKDICMVTTPFLTTIDQRSDQLAAAMIALLFELLDHGSVPENRRGVVVRPDLIVREST